MALNTKALGEIPSLTPEEYLDTVLKQAEDRVRIIKRTHQRLRYLITVREDVIMSKVAQYEEIRNKVLLPVFEQLWRWISAKAYNYTLEMKLRFYLSQTITAVSWLHPKKLHQYLPSGSLSQRVKILTRFKTGDRVSDMLNIMSVSKVMGELTSLMHTTAMVASSDRELFMKIIDPEYASVASPIAHTILMNTMFNYTRGTMEGGRIGIFGDLGSGKTSLCFYSLYSVLRMIGMTEEEAIKSTSALMINDPLELVVVMKEVTTNDIFAPAVVADDVASMISKHWMMEGTHVKKAVMHLVRALKISRENFGLILFPSDVKESITKSIRESLDGEIHGETIKHKLRTATTWLRTKKTTHMPMKFNSKQMRRQEIIEELIATTHPPMLIPPTIYSKLKEQKRRARMLWLTKAEEEFRKAIEQAEEKEEKEATKEKEPLADWGI